MEDEERDWINKRNMGGNIFIIATPFSGADYLNAIIKAHGHHGLCHNTLATQINSLVAVWGNYYGTLEFDRFHKPTTTAVVNTDEIDSNMRKYNLRSLLFRNSSANLVAYTESHFFEDQLSTFVEFLRDIHDTPFTKTFKIVWLTRAADRIEDASALDISKTQAEKIIQNFRSCYELGDININYEDLVRDPLAVLKKLRVKHFPTQAIIDKVHRV